MSGRRGTIAIVWSGSAGPVWRVVQKGWLDELGVVPGVMVVKYICSLQ